MYVPLNQSTCTQPPLPANFADAARAEQARLTSAITAAQGAVSLGTFRPDLGPDGQPWNPCNLGLTPPIKPQSVDPRGGNNDPQWLALLKQGGVYHGIAQPNGCLAGPPTMTPGGGLLPGGGFDYRDGGTGGGIPIGPGGTPNNPRVVQFPFCTPLSSAARYQPPTGNDGCYGNNTGLEFPVSFEFAQHPQLSPPSIPTPVPTNSHQPIAAPAPPVPSGDVCTDLRNGVVLQSQVPMETVYDCSVRGYVGVMPSPIEVTRAALSGLGDLRARMGVGIGACADGVCESSVGGPCTSCAGNDPATLPPGWSESPAERYRRGGDDIPWGKIALIAGAAFVLTRGKRTPTRRRRNG